MAILVKDKPKIKILEIIDFGNKLKKENKFENYCSIIFEVENKIYIRSKYGLDEAHNIGKYIYNYIYNYIGKDEIIGNHLPGSYIGLVKHKSIPALIKKLNTIKFINVDGEEEIINLKIVYYAIKNDEKIANAIDNVISGMERVIYNNNISILDYDGSYEYATIEEEKVLYLFDKALKNKEFIPFYQPKVNSLNNTINGAEALVRWKHDGEFICPSKFIPILENCGKMCALDFYILEVVCFDIKSWIDQGIKPVKTSVNFSRLNFKNPNFAKNILKIIKKHNIPTKYIEIEITETVKDNDFDIIKNFIKIMHENNIEVSMDDFGSGYSSIAAITNLDFDTIKIDKALVDNLNNRKNFTILSMFSKLCKKFFIKTVVECVETEKEIILLNSIGLNNIQGYYYDQPLEKNEFTKRLINKKYKDKNNLFNK